MHKRAGGGEAGVASRPDKPVEADLPYGASVPGFPQPKQSPRVSGNATVGFRSRVTGNSEVHAGAKLSGKTKVEDSVVEKDASLKNVRVTSNSRVGEHVEMENSECCRQRWTSLLAKTAVGKPFKIPRQDGLNRSEE